MDGNLQKLLDHGYGVVLTRDDTESYTAVAVKSSGPSRPLRTYQDARLGNQVSDGYNAEEAVQDLVDKIFCTGQYEQKPAKAMKKRRRP